MAQGEAIADPRLRAGRSRLTPGVLLALLLVKAAFGSPDDGGRAIGLLYAINTLGAVLGTLVAGFVLIERVGISGSIAVAAALNLAAGVAAVGLGQRLAASEQVHDPTVAAASSPAVCPVTLLTILPGLLAVSGFCSLA